MMRMPRWMLPACALLCLLGVPALQGQEVTQSPHGQLKEACADCHSSSGWTPAHISRAFDHGKSGFALTGAHAQTACRSCHASLTFTGAPKDCVNCHKDVHGGELGVDCARCHTPRSFVDRARMVQMHQATRFPLTGTHAVADCEACHEARGQGGLTWVNRPTQCQDCHISSYLATTNPDHQASGFPRTCDQCHASSVWNRARFNHDASGFPLTGAHRSTACDQCHGDGVYTGKPTACVACHQQDYNGTTNPNHQQSGFPTSCTDCHTTTSWQGATFDHNTTQFPLTGSHKAVPCDQCHGDGVYKGKPTACVACHQQDYNGTTNPNHQQSGFPTSCTDCHTTTSWQGATFDHNSTQFPLTGSHKAVPCDQCHGDGVYAGKPTACVACHQTDYNGTTNPPHQASGFPTTCADCHTTSGWTGATFNHDGPYFPIYSGTHLGRWISCADCHTNPSAYSQFSCITCHDHSQSNTDGHHTGVSGYQYNSQACYSCHPTGRAG